MATLLHQIRMERWLADNPTWLAADQATADEVTDLETRGNTLSVYEVPAGDQTGITQIAGALIAGKGKLIHFEYVIFDSAILDALAIRTRVTPGKTVDPTVNAWHRDLIELTGDAICRLAAQLRQQRRDRILDEEVANYVADQIRAGNRFSRTPNLESVLRQKKYLT